MDAVLRQALGMEGQGGVEENTVSFEVYPASLNTAATELEALRAQLLDHVLPHLRGYIWQRDRFTLQLSTQHQAPWQRWAAAGSQRRQGADGGKAAPAAAVPPTQHLWGSVDFGDNLEDEWFVVWLLLELTRAFPITARVWDNDGEFLLIEAAYGLPRWLKPETAQNRLWLHAGTVHLVPLPRFAGDPLLAATPSLAQALSAVRGGDVGTAVPPKLAAALAPRLAGYPERATEQMHVAHALLPARVAYLLAAEPQLVAAAVEAFHYRDPDDMKAAARMAAFPPSDLVLAAPTFSRCLYAQLALQEYAPPRGWPMPMPTDPQFKAAEVGLKLAAGFEMMYANQARFGHTNASEEAEAGDAQRGSSAGDADAAASGQQAGEEALAGDPCWAAFRARLERSGYFRGALPGSAQHQELLAAAVGSYRQSEAYRRATAALAAPALRVDELLRQPVDPAALPPPLKLPSEGSEAWLHADVGLRIEAELEARQRELEEHQQRKAQRQQQRAAQQQEQQQQQSGSDGGGVGEEFDPTELAGRLHAFVDAMAGLEGAEMPSGRSAAAASGEAGVALDEDAFAAELRRVLGLGKAALRGLGGAVGGGSDSGDESESSEEGSSFYGDGGSQSGSYGDLSDAEEEQQQRPACQKVQQTQQAPAAPAAASPAWQLRAEQQQAAGPEAAASASAAAQVKEEEGWEVGTATDSDDEFMDAYGQAMDVQLAGTRMAESFERAPEPAGADGADGQQQPGGAEPAAGGKEEGPAVAALRPVDIDVNLVKSLLASYGEQGGLPGPAGTLAGLMGLKLPDQ